MADTTTPNFALVKPEIGASRDSWGTKGNQNLDKIDTALQANKTKADNALPKTGGALTGGLTRDGEGAFFHFKDAALTSGQGFLVPSAGTDPTTAPGDIWFGFTP